MSKKHKKVCRVLSYTDHLLIIISIMTGCVSTSTFASLVGIPVVTTSSTIVLKTGVITTWIKKSIIRKKKKNDNILLLAKPKLNSKLLKF